MIETNVLAVVYVQVFARRYSKWILTELLDGFPSVNMMGFGIRIETGDDFEVFKKHFAAFLLAEREKLAEFANRWLDISRYRTIRYL